MEYFAASPVGGMKTKQIIENTEKDELITLNTTLGELSCLYFMKDKDFSAVYDVILANSTIREVPLSDWKTVGTFRKDMREALKDNTVGIMDALLICAANRMHKELNKEVKIVTGDPHFKKLSRIPKYRKMIQLI